VAVSELVLPSLHGDARPGEFRLVNRAKAGLVTFVMTLTYENDAGEQLTVTGISDSWVSDRAFLGGSAEAQLPILKVVRGSRIARVTARPLYAEFDDGTKMGPAAESLGCWLASERSRTIEAYRDALRVYRTRGAKALRTTLQENEDLDWLLGVDAQGGLRAVVAELAKARRLGP
jgi:hypothetical protein